MSEQNQVNFERVRKGDDVWVQVDGGGGTARKRMERDGFMVSADPFDVFVSDEDVGRVAQAISDLISAHQ